MARTILIVVGVILIVFLVVWAVRQTGLRLFGGSTSTLPTDLAALMPDGWVAIESLQPVNIDHDDVSESTLYYSYDTGQIGGVIYDAQTTPLGNQAVPVPSQSPTYLVPYRLLPDYVGTKTNGYLSDATLEYKQVYFDKAGDNKAPATVSRDRLMVQGIRNSLVNHFSVFWWIDPQAGYGGATVSTAGWLSLSDTAPNNWDAWTNLEYIHQVWNWEPLADRSALCRRSSWVLNDTSATTQPNPPVFVKDPGTGDLFFCTGKLPPSPAFPEAQVLAYLIDNSATRLDPNYTNAPKFSKAKVFRITAPADLTTMHGNQIVVTGEVDFVSNGQPYAMWWATEMVAPQSVKQTVSWEITGLTPR